MTSFFGRIVERARSPIGTLHAPAGVPRLDLETESGEASPEATTSVLGPLANGAVQSVAPPSADAGAAAVEPTVARSAVPAARAPVPAAREWPATDAVAPREAALGAAPLRDAGVRAVAPVPPAGGREPGEPRAPRAPRAPSVDVEKGTLVESTPPAVAALAAPARPELTPELERRWRELGQRLIEAHPPAPAVAERYERAVAAAAIPALAREPRSEARRERDLPESPFVLARPSPRVTSPARTEVPAPSDAEAEVVIRNLEVTVAAPRAEPEPPRQRPGAPERGGAWNVAARRYLTRI